MRFGFAQSVPFVLLRLRSLLSALFFAIASSQLVLADDTPKPPELFGAIAASKPAGAATLQKYFVTVYHAALWRDSKGAVFDAPFALCLTYALAISNQDFATTSVKILREANLLPESALDKAGKILAQNLPSVAAGDRICALYHPSQPLVFYHNSKVYGHISDPSLAKAFLGIWLSPKTPEPDLRTALLSGG